MSMNLLSVGSVFGKIWPFLVAVLFFGLLIFVHELGHFVFARIFGVKVNEFSMGMGPALFKHQKGDTLYSLRLLPIGGYCLMEGEDENSEDEGAFCNKKPWQRFIIVAAGGVVNLILGFLIVVLMLATTDDLIGTPYIHSFDENAVSDTWLSQGDKILKINGKRIFSTEDISYFMSTDKDGVFDFVVERGGEKVTLNGVKFDTVVKEIDGEERLTIIYDFIIVGVNPSFKTVVPNAFKTSLSYGRLVYISLFDLITGTYHVSDLSGPIGTVTFIADAASESAKETDFEFLFTILALIAINIGLFNLLPLPALDGGRLFFILIEMIIRRPVPKKFEGLVHAVGMALLLALMAVVSFSDIWKLIKG